MADFIVAGILVIVVVAAIIYIRKARKNGARCIGCPSGCSCSCRKDGGCHSQTKCDIL